MFSQFTMQPYPNPKSIHAAPSSTTHIAPTSLLPLQLPPTKILLLFIKKKLITKSFLFQKIVLVGARIELRVY